MDTRQALLQIRKIMRALVFPGSTTKIFGAAGDQFWIGRHSLRIAQPQAMGNQDYIHGAAWLGDSIADPEEPELVTQDIHVGVVIFHAEDVADLEIELPAVLWDGTTEKAGIAKVAGLVSENVQRLGPDNGFTHLEIIREISMSPVLRGYYRELVFRAILTRSPHYPSHLWLLGSDAGGGNASLTWALPPGARFDRTGQTLEYLAGATPPASVGSGIDVPLTSVDMGAIMATGAGQFSFSLWAEYDDDWPLDGVTDSYSRALTATITVI